MHPARAPRAGFPSLEAGAPCTAALLFVLRVACVWGGVAFCGVGVGGEGRVLLGWPADPEQKPGPSSLFGVFRPTPLCRTRIRHYLHRGFELSAPVWFWHGAPCLLGC
jgi:hypothetical protein